MVAQTDFAGSGLQERRTGDAGVGWTAVIGLLSSLQTSCAVLLLYFIYLFIHGKIFSVTL